MVYLFLICRCWIVCFSFDFCLADKKKSPVENLGQVVFGERIRPSPYVVRDKIQHLSLVAIFPLFGDNLPSTWWQKSSYVVSTSNIVTSLPQNPVPLINLILQYTKPAQLQFSY